MELETIIYCNFLLSQNIFSLLFFVLLAKLFDSQTLIGWKFSREICCRNLKTFHYTWLLYLTLLTFQMKTTQLRQVITLTNLRSESSSSTNCNHKNTVTITFLLRSTGELSLLMIYLKLDLTWFLFQHSKLHSIVLVRTVPAILELFLPFHRPSPTNTWCVTHRSLHDSGSTDIHPDCQCTQGDCRRFRKLNFL